MDFSCIRPDSGNRYHIIDPRYIYSCDFDSDEKYTYYIEIIGSSYKVTDFFGNVINDNDLRYKISVKLLSLYFSKFGKNEEPED